MRVEEVPAETTHDLRRRVLREARPDAVVAFPEDDRPGAFHLAVRDDGDCGAMVAVASFSPEPCPHRSGRAAVRLRGMAVERHRQGQGVGRLLVAAAADRLREAGVAVLWCNARDSALGFYAGMGFEVVSEGFVLPDSGQPHHVMVRDL